MENKCPKRYLYMNRPLQHYSHKTKGENNPSVLEQLSGAAQHVLSTQWNILQPYRNEILIHMLLVWTLFSLSLTSISPSSHPETNIFSTSTSFLLSPHSPFGDIICSYKNSLYTRDKHSKGWQTFLSKEPDSKQFRLCKLQPLLWLFNSM